MISSSPNSEYVKEEAAALHKKVLPARAMRTNATKLCRPWNLELIDFRDILAQIAPTYHPNHDDGVQITAAPLWPLFRHKPWQKI